MAYDNAKLVELFEKIQRKNHLEAVLKELRENIAQLGLVHTAKKITERQS